MHLSQLASDADDLKFLKAEWAASIPRQCGRPARLTPDGIEVEANAELHRVMLEIFGFDKYIEARGAQLVASSIGFGGYGEVAVRCSQTREHHQGAAPMMPSSPSKA